MSFSDKQRFATGFVLAGLQYTENLDSKVRLLGKEGYSPRGSVTCGTHFGNPSFNHEWMPTTVASNGPMHSNRSTDYEHHQLVRTCPSPSDVDASLKLQGPACRLILPTHLGFNVWDSRAFPWVDGRGRFGMEALVLKQGVGFVLLQVMGD